MSLDAIKSTFILFFAMNFISSESFTADNQKKPVELKNMPRVIMFTNGNKTIEIPGNTIVNFANKMGRDCTNFNVASFSEISTNSIFNARTEIEKMMIVVNAALQKTGQKPVTVQEVITVFSSEKK